MKLLEFSADMEGMNANSGWLPNEGGVPFSWFPMRVTYNRELRIKSCFDELGIECFVPMKYELDADASDGKERLVPAIHNLIFVHSTQEKITGLKMGQRDFAPLRYMMTHTDNGRTRVMTVRDEEMNNFMRVASVQDRSVFLVEDSDYFSKIGRMVKITDGQLKGVVGVVKRIKKNRCVVVRIQGVAAAVIANVPARFVEEICPDIPTIG